MSFRMPRRVKDLLIKYVREYAKRILESKHDLEIINHFDINKATEAATKAILVSEEITDKEKELMKSEEGQQKIKDFFKEKLVINYFMFARDISYYEAKSLITSKGTEYFNETKGIKNSIYQGKYKDYEATQKQIDYIKCFNVEIKHMEELSGREASLIISCLKNPKKTKPAYFTYYISVKNNQENPV